MSTDYQNYKKGMAQTKTIKQLDSLLKKEGYKFTRQNGSHGIYKNEARGIVVSVKMNEVTRGTLRNVMQLVYPSWNVKPIETTDDSKVETTESTFELTESMITLAIELELDIDNLTQVDYDTLKELTEAC